MTELSVEQENSISQLTQLARDGSPEAQTSLALRLLQEGKADFQEIAYWLSLSAESNDALAQWKLALFYAIGKGVQKNLEKSRAYFEKFLLNDKHEEISEQYSADEKILYKALGIPLPTEGTGVKLRTAISDEFSATAARSCLAFFERKIIAYNRKHATTFWRLAFLSILFHALIIGVMPCFKKVGHERTITSEISLELSPPAPVVPVVAKAESVVPPASKSPLTVAAIPQASQSETAESSTSKSSNKTSEAQRVNRADLRPDALPLDKKNDALPLPATAVRSPYVSGSTEKAENSGQGKSNSGIKWTDWSKDGWLSSGSGSSFGGKDSSDVIGGTDDDRCIGIMHVQRVADGSSFYTFNFQTFFKPEIMLEGPDRQWLLERWKDKHFDENLAALEELVSKMESEGRGHSEAIHKPLLVLSSLKNRDESSKYRLKLLDFCREKYGNYSPEVTQTECILADATSDPSFPKLMEEARGTSMFDEKNDLQTALMHRTYANAFCHENKFDDAENEFLKCLKIIDSLPVSEVNEEEKALTKVSLGSMYIDFSNKTDKALPLIVAAKEYAVANKEKHAWLEPLCLSLLGEIQLLEGRKWEAKPLFESASAVLPKTNNPRSIYYSIDRVVSWKLAQLK